jgi:SPP1 family predicted phage head-tail adaptor
MSAGKLDRIIQIRRPTLVDDGFAQVETYQVLGQRIPAHFMDVSDNERLRASQVQAMLTSRFQVRYSGFTKAITQKDQIVFELRIYDIVGIKEMQGRRRMLELTAAARSDLPLIDPPLQFSEEFSEEFA